MIPKLDTSPNKVVYIGRYPTANDAVTIRKVATNKIDTNHNRSN